LLFHEARERRAGVGCLVLHDNKVPFDLQPIPFHKPISRLSVLERSLRTRKTLLEYANFVIWGFSGKSLKLPVVRVRLSANELQFLTQRLSLASRFGE
jgi:hypothetical protein